MCCSAAVLVKRGLQVHLSVSLSHTLHLPPPQALLGGIESRCSSGGLSAAQRAAAAAALSPAFAAGSGGRGTPKRGSSSGGGEGGPSSPPQRHYTAADYRAAYQSGRIPPSDVAENIIEAVAASEAQVRLCPAFAFAATRACSTMALHCPTPCAASAGAELASCT